MRVLLVEDDPTTSKSIELMLTHANLNIYATDLGEEGIDLAKLYDYDLILLDLNLPDMNGHEVLRQLRLSKVDTPILILSGDDDTESKLKGLVLVLTTISRSHSTARNSWRVFMQLFAGQKAMRSRSSKRAVLLLTSTPRLSM
jgi:CheY-like chemotaxis protein